MASLRLRARAAGSESRTCGPALGGSSDRRPRSAGSGLPPLHSALFTGQPTEKGATIHAPPAATTPATGGASDAPVELRAAFGLVSRVFVRRASEGAASLARRANEHPHTILNPALARRRTRPPARRRAVGSATWARPSSVM